jgi:hypothetical protein
MALSRVQVTPKVSGTGTATLTFSTPPSVGNAIAVLLSLWAADQPPGATDNYGNAYQGIVWQANGNPRIAILVCPTIRATGASFTMTVVTGTAGVAYYAGAAVEVTGLAGGLFRLDQAASGTGSSATPATGTTAALTGSDVFSVAVFAFGAGLASITVDSVSPAWTQEYEELPFTNVPGEGDSRARSSAVGTTESCGWTCNTSGAWAAAVAAFRAVPLAAVAVTGAVSHSFVTTSSSSLSFSHVSNGASLVVAVGLFNSAQGASVTYGGTALTLISRQSGSSQYIEWWFLAAPVAGTATLSITTTGSTFFTAVARNVTGGGTPYNVTSAAATSTTPSVAVTSAVGDLVLDLIVNDNNRQVFTPGAGQTIDMMQWTNTADERGAASEKAGAASVTMSWTLLGSDNWLLSGLSIPPGAPAAVARAETFILLPV